MNKHPSSIKIRVEFEPNRFASDCLEKVYEQLMPIDSRTISDKCPDNETSEPTAAIKGDKK